MPKPQKHTAQIETTTMLNDKIMEITLTLVEPTKINFLAGQFVNVQVAPATFRAYSISTPPSNATEITLLAAVGHNGVGASFFKECKTGDTVNFIGPSGQFVLPEQLPNKVIFIATGTGIAPILAMLETLAEQECAAALKLYFGVRTRADLFKNDQLETLTRRLQDFEYHICYSQENVDTKTEHYGRVLKYAPLDNPAAYYVICGHPDMIQETTENLLKNSVPQKNIFREKFTKTVLK